jgi:hypothetical protein
MRQLALFSQDENSEHLRTRGVSEFERSNLEAALIIVGTPERYEGALLDWAKRYLTRRLGEESTMKSSTNWTALRMLRALEIFEDRGWLNCLAWRSLMDYRPRRGAHGYLFRMHRSGLLLRSFRGRGLLLYRLSANGKRRLEHLRALVGPQAEQTLNHWER